MPPPRSPFSEAAGGVRAAVRVVPRATCDRVAGAVIEADGGAALKVMVTAVPEAGKANAALIKLLAKEWGVPKRAIRIAAGAAARRKTLHLTGRPGPLRRRLDAWLAGIEERPSRSDRQAT